MESNDWAIGDLVCMYFFSVSGGDRIGPTMGLITAASEKEGYWKVMYESEWGVRTDELPCLIFYRPEN